MSDAESDVISEYTDSSSDDDSIGTSVRMPGFQNVRTKMYQTDTSLHRFLEPHLDEMTLNDLIDQGMDADDTVRVAYSMICGGDADVWEHPSFDEQKKMFQNENDMIDNPFPVSESAEPCPRCNSTRTLTYSKQTRSADEGTTTFMFCGGCGKTSRL